MTISHGYQLTPIQKRNVLHCTRDCNDRSGALISLKIIGHTGERRVRYWTFSHLIAQGGSGLTFHYLQVGLGRRGAARAERSLTPVPQHPAEGVRAIKECRSIQVSGKHPHMVCTCMAPCIAGEQLPAHDCRALRVTQPFLLEPEQQTWRWVISHSLKESYTASIMSLCTATIAPQPGTYIATL